MQAPLADQAHPARPADPVDQPALPSRQPTSPSADLTAPPTGGFVDLPAHSPVTTGTVASQFSPSDDLERLAARSELASSALSELRGLYEPSFTPVTVPQPTAPGELVQRTPKAADVPAPNAAAPTPVRGRNAAEVRGMLSGFRAGVERGRGTAPNGASTADHQTTD